MSLCANKLVRQHEALIREEIPFPVSIRQTGSFNFAVVLSRPALGIDRRCLPER